MSERQKASTSGDRPQSTIAQNFSATLDNAFGMDDTPQPNLQPNIAGLSESVEQKKRAVTTQNQELEALQARLRETEQQLQQTSTSKKSPNDLRSSTSTQRHDAQGSTAEQIGREPVGASGETQSVGRRGENPQPKHETRPQAAKGISYSVAHMPGAMPQTSGDDDFQAAWDSATPERTERR
ncbi:MAG: hypothetical protein M1836_003418 [Candelina mexicana]|nr:MAG: hypothetical protein M1836_003418 [Candelina mexicana]